MKACSLAFRAIDGNRAIPGLDNAMAECEPETEPSPHPLGREKRTEKPCVIFRGDSTAGIGNRQNPVFRIVPEGETDLMGT